MSVQAIYVSLLEESIGGPEAFSAPVFGSWVVNMTRREFFKGSNSFVETRAVCEEIPISPDQMFL